MTTPTMTAQTSLTAERIEAINRENASRAQKSQMQKAVFKHNLATLVAALAPLGCTQVDVEYSGSGDSGDQCDVTFLPPDIDVDDAMQVKGQTVASHYSSGAWEYSIVESDVSLSDLAGSVCDACIDATGHDGYQNGEGGGGSLTINMQTGRIQFEHYDNVVTQEYEHYALDPATGAIGQRDGSQTDDAELALPAPSA